MMQIGLEGVLTAAEKTTEIDLQAGL